MHNFVLACGNATVGNTNTVPKNAVIPLKNESEKLEHKSNKTRSRGTGKIVGGVFLLFVGIIGVDWDYGRIIMQPKYAKL